MMIDSTPVCLDCVKTIIPKFQAAAQYEINYPVEWSANMTLNPQDFAKFFDDFPSFLSKWTEREREYRTSGKDRLYCQGCSGYVGDRTRFLFKIALCNTCKIWVCSHCGSKDKDSPHECRTDAEEDGVKDLEGCKKCPGCFTPIVLEDGCNDVVCVVCRLRHCYCCGEMDPRPEHWSRSRGGACTRFNAPGAENALFNEDVDADPEEHELGGREGVQDIARWNFGTHMEIRVLTALLPSSFDPALHPNTTGFERPIIEGQRHIMNWQRDVMQSLVNSSEGVQRDLREEALLERNPDLGERLLDAASKLATNVDLYIFFVRIQEAHADYSRRHEDIMDFINHVMPAELFAFWPALYSAFEVYQQVAPARLAAAAPRSDA
jgi:hypothetical protein